MEATENAEISINLIIVIGVVGSVFLGIGTVLVILLRPKCCCKKKTKTKATKKEKTPVVIGKILTPMRKKSRYAFEKTPEEKTAISSKSEKEEPAAKPKSPEKKKKKKGFDKEMVMRHKKYMVDKKKADKEAENFSKFKKMGKIHIPKEATAATFLQNCKAPNNVVLEQAYFDERLNEQYDIGTDVDDIELDETTTVTTTTYATTVTLYNNN